MLLSHYGASMLGKTLRRRRNLMTTMNSIDGNTATTFASEKMRSAATKMGGRALSTPARSNTTPPSNRTWSPNNGIVFSGTWSPNQGIVFRPAAGTPRSMSTSDVETMRQEHLLHSQVEDEYVMASADTTALERQSTVTSQATTAADLKKVAAQDVKKSKASRTSKTTVAEAKASETKVPEVVPELEPEDPRQNELPETTTTLKMTEELFRKAKNAEAGSRDSYWSHSLYRGPLKADGKEHKTTVHYCKSILTTERVLATYFSDSKVIGFDIEWKEGAHRNSNPKQNVSLIQIANEERIALFHVALYSGTDLVAPTFKKLMENSEVTKVGVSIKADCTRLRKNLGIESKGIFELSHLHRLVKFSTSKNYGEINRRLVSLAKQTQEHLHLPMFKGDVRISDWSKALNLDQIMYAASDSYAGLQIFYTLEKKRKELDPTPPRPYHAELNLPIRIAEGVEIPSDAEAEEVEPEDPTESTTPISKTGITKTLSEKELEAATETISLEDPELEYALTGRSPVPTPLTGNTVPGPSSNSLPEYKPPSLFSSYTSPLVHEAETLASSHLDEMHNRRVRRPNRNHLLSSPSASTPSYSPSIAAAHLRGRNLRTYFLWFNNPELSLEDIGKLLRRPPLSARSVAIAILEAVRVERMEFERERLREVLGKWRGLGNAFVVAGKYGELEKECGVSVEEGEDAEVEGEGVDENAKISNDEKEGKKS